MPSNPYSVLSASTSCTSNLFTACVLTPKPSPKLRQHLSYASSVSSNLSHSPNPSLILYSRFHSRSEKRGDKFSVCMVKKLGKGDTALLDEEDEMDDEFDDFAEDNEEEIDEDEETFLPIGNMRKWLENKPRGFGEGKVYDTSIEDRLMEEIEASRKAQAANIDSLKKNAVEPASVKEDKKKATELAPSGIRVSLTNLPKKKNIDRDLRLAFKEVAGIVNIIPAVSGNKKTKDPICKGYAFVDFKSEEFADRFVQQFSGQNVAFGKIQKEIKCSMKKSQSSTSSDDESSCSDSDKTDSVTIDNSFSEEEETDEFVTSESQIVSDKGESFSISEHANEETMPSKMKPTNDLSSSSERAKKQASKKKKASIVKEQKVPKLEIPGSAKRLKIKEKSVLVDVFSKYGSQSTLVSGGDT